MRLFSDDVNGCFVLPKKVMNFLSNAKKSEIKLILYIFANINEGFDAERAAKALSETPESISSALAFWRGTGVISEIEDETEPQPSEPQEKEPLSSVQTEVKTTSRPSDYSVEEVAKARQNDKDFSQLVDYTEHMIGVLLNSSNVASLLYLYDNLGIQCDVIMGVVAYCVSIGKNSIHYIERTAAGIHNDGVVTYKELESYLAAKKSRAEYEGKVKSIVGADGRALIKKEKDLIAKWENEFHTPLELVSLAYERTITNTSKPNLPYMSTIIESWYKKGITTEKAAREEISQHSAKPAEAKGTNGNFDIDDLEDIFEKP